MVKSKRAREAAESVAEPAVAVEVNGSSATQDKKLKKRKRDVEDEPTGDDTAASEAKKSKKEKKDKKSKKHDKESRKEKKDKRKNLQDLPDEVVEDAASEDGAGPSEDTPQAAEPKATNEDSEAKRKEEKRARKQAKREEKKRQQADQGTADSTSKSKDKSSTSSATAPSGNAQADDSVKTTEDPIGLDDEAANGKKDRHIVFVGNLPFSATAASISAHFASLSPVAVRCLRNRDDPNPCRGIAFVEFGKVWHQRTCLDKFHHSTFDDGVSPARKINVELTAGGGGKTKQRQQKIKDKNKKLDENRAKRIEREKVAKQEGNGADSNKASQEDYMHPSRRARIPGGGGW